MRYHIGDVVEYVGTDIWSKRHIIHEISHHEGDLSPVYSTNKGAWFTGEDFKLIRRANKKSLRKLKKDISAEYK